jgi:Domain of unknown function (DUF5615)
MAFGLYMDVHLPRAITEGLRRRAVDVLTSQEDGTRELEDEELLLRATQLDRLLVTQDEDLLAIAAKWQVDQRDFPSVVYCPQLGSGIGEIIEDLELFSFCARPDEARNRVIYLPLR